jgi:hypothetical protein
MTTCAKFSCLELATDVLHAGGMMVDACRLHAEELMWEISHTVPVGEGREGYYRWCRDRGITPRVWA